MPIITKSQQQTINLGKKIAKNIKTGTVLALEGELGTGKTQFTKGIAKHLGITQNITSPTFTILKQYKTNHPVIKKLIHIDCYRLTSSEELLDLGFEELLTSENLIVIEWASKVKKILPKHTIPINFQTNQKENTRIIDIPELI